MTPIKSQIWAWAGSNTKTQGTTELSPLWDRKTLTSNHGYVWKWGIPWYTPNYSHLVGIMISKTIGFRGLASFQTHPYFRVYIPLSMVGLFGHSSWKPWWKIYLAAWQKPYLPVDYVRTSPTCLASSMVMILIHIPCVHYTCTWLTFVDSIPFCVNVYFNMCLIPRGSMVLEYLPTLTPKVIQNNPNE